MAQQDTFLDRIRRLFSSNVIVRNVGGRKLRVIDTDDIQQGSRTLMDRYTKMFNTGAGYSSHMGYSGELAKAQRMAIFRDYEAMDDDSILASALDVYADESTMKSEYGNVLEIKSNNAQIKEILHNLFYDILNIEFNLWPWIRNMCKYGDFYLHLEISEKYGIVNVMPLSPYDISRVENFDPENPYDVKFVLDATDPRNVIGNTNRKELENFEVAHFRLLSDSNYAPYGKSMIEGGRRTWKQLSLMEDAMLIHRIMRAPEKRIFKIDIGNLPPNEVDTYMKRIMDKSKKAPVVDEQTGEYNLRYNMQNLTEDFYLPVRGGDSGTQIEQLPGLTYEAVEDIEYLRNKLLAALKIPKAFLGYEEQVGSKATLAAEDVRFARTIERIQRITISELTKIAVAHLYAQGFTDSALVDFDLELTSPSTIYEQERLDLWEKKNSIAESMKREGMISEDWIYDNVFGFSDEEVDKIREQVVEDKKQTFRKNSIENEGNDPAQPAQEGQMKSDQPSMSDENEDNDDNDRDKEDRETYGVRDVLGKYDYTHSTKKDNTPDIKQNYRKSPLALAHLDAMTKSMKKSDVQIIKEIEVLDEQLNGNEKD
mgnify:FL=1|tara:strand:+ start:3264 stop:5051 length:1788 start_codon:yes stop_codon:yes gene_type:complete